MRHGRCWWAGILLLTLLLNVQAPVAGAQAGQPPQDVIIMLDTSGSMTGLGTDPKAQDIWKRVLNNLADLVQAMPAGARIMILPFDQGVHTDLARTYPTRPARQDVVAYLDTLQANGQETYIYESVVTALQQLKTWTGDQPHRPQALYIYTDGLDNGPHSATWVTDLSQQIKLQRSDNPDLYTYYHDLQSQLSPAQVQELNASGVPVSQGFAQVNVPVLDFGTFAVGETTKTQTLPFFFTSDVPPTTITMQLQAAGLPLHIEPTQAQIGTKTPNIPVTLYLDGPMAAGVHTEVKLRLTAADGLELPGSSDIPVRFQIAAQPTATATATQMPTPAPSPTMTPTTTASPTPAPTATAEATATPVPPPPPPAPPDMLVTLTPNGPSMSLDTASLHFGMPITFSQPRPLVVSVALVRHGDATDRPMPFSTWFAPNQPPTFRLMAVPSPANDAACVATHWCDGINFSSPVTALQAKQSILPERLIGKGQQLQVHVIGDGVLVDGRTWHQESSPATINGTRSNWATIQLGIGFWVVVVVLIVVLASAMDTRFSRPL